MEAAERIEESAEDMTAADIAPKPKNEMKSGHIYCRQRGKTSFKFFPSGACPYSVWFQSEKKEKIFKILRT